MQKPLVQHFSRRLDRTGGTIRGISKERKGKQLDLGGGLFLTSLDSLFLHVTIYIYIYIYSGFP